MAAAGLDALIVSDPANMNYLTGYDGWSFYVHQCVIVAQDIEQPIWIGRGQDANGARLTTILPPENIVGYTDDHVQSTAKHPMQVVARVLDGARPRAKAHRRRSGLLLFHGEGARSAAT